ncbi:MAG: DUF4442 domain-containing protein [Ferruginibacter sp.]|nr:DUF4442 domain-containing protein [Ferruginibacter sp.]
MKNAQKFLDLVQHPIRFRVFLLTKLPSAFFSGLRINYVDHNQARVKIKYGWFTKNPFRSTYFACLSMAAEMSTGILAWMNVYGKKPPVSMLVIRTEANFLKRATTSTLFTCEDGPAISQAVDEAFASGKTVNFAARSTGRNESGEIVAELIITWSFKAKPTERLESNDSQKILNN